MNIPQNSNNPHHDSLEWNLINVWQIPPKHIDSLDFHKLIILDRSSFLFRAYRGFMVRESTIFQLIPLHPPESWPEHFPSPLYTAISFRKAAKYQTGYALYKDLAKLPERARSAILPASGNSPVDLELPSF